MPSPGGGGDFPQTIFTFVQWGIQGAVLTGTYYAPPFGYQGANITEAVYQWPCPVSGTLRNLRVHMRTAPTAPAVHTLRVNVNGIATPVQVSVSAAGGRVYQDTTNTYPVTAGDLLSLAVISTIGVGVSMQEVQVSAEIS